MFIAIALMFLLILFPSSAAEGCARGLQICAKAVVPALFPFLFAAKVLSSQQVRIRNRLLYAFVFSLLGGYPVGVATVCSMYQERILTKRSAEQAIVFCNNSGPGFFIGLIGSIFGDVRLGLVLYAIHVFSAIICAMLFAPNAKKITVQPIVSNKKSFAQSFSDAIGASCTSMLQISALVTLFQSFSTILETLPMAEHLPQAILFGSLELTSGISRLSATPNSFVIAAFLMGWGGFCVHMQAMTLWKSVGLNVHHYFAEKLLHGLISAQLAYSFHIGIAFFCFSLLLWLTVCVFSNICKKWGRKKQKVIV